MDENISSREENKNPESEYQEKSYLLDDSISKDSQSENKEKNYLSDDSIDDLDA